MMADNLRVLIVEARFYGEIADEMLAGASEALQAYGAEYDVISVPGAFELPLAAKLLANTHRYHGVIALGAVIRGGTPHFDYVAGEAARGLQEAALETGIPVAFGVLTTDTLEQAESRAGGADGNKGFDAAMTAIEMARLALRVTT